MLFMLVWLWLDFVFRSKVIMRSIRWSVKPSTDIGSSWVRGRKAKRFRSAVSSGGGPDLLHILKPTRSEKRFFVVKYDLEDGVAENVIQALNAKDALTIWINETGLVNKAKHVTVNPI